MKIKGIKWGNTTELIDQIIDIPDGTEITLISEEQAEMTPEAYLEKLQTFFDQLKLRSDDFSAASRISTNDTPLTSLIGSAPGSFATSEKADQFIRQERDTWDV